MERISAPRGTQDILPPDSELWIQLEETIRRNGERFVYGEIRTPIFEHSELFARGVGPVSYTHLTLPTKRIV